MPLNLEAGDEMADWELPVDISCILFMSLFCSGSYCCDAVFLFTMSNSDFQTEEYEVFLSFRGSDVRQSFADHLYACLVRSKIRTFRDDEVLQKGETIAKMVDCYKNGGSGSSNGQQIILPVFYFMDARAVRHPDSGSYKEAFDRHSLKHDPETVLEWKEALQEIGKMKGWHVTGSDGQGAVIDQILTQVQLHLITSKVVITELRVPTEWEIQVNRDRNGILGLTEGLTDFFDFYSIANKYLLMFGLITQQLTQYRSEARSHDLVTLKAELENVKTRMAAELQKDYLELQQEYAKLNNKNNTYISLGLDEDKDFESLPSESRRRWSRNCRRKAEISFHKPSAQLEKKAGN
ncbi:Disease resistance protein L6 [Linum perenne]